MKSWRAKYRENQDRLPSTTEEALTIRGLVAYSCAVAGWSEERIGQEFGALGPAAKMLVQRALRKLLKLFLLQRPPSRKQPAPEEFVAALCKPHAEEWTRNHNPTAAPPPPVKPPADESPPITENAPDKSTSVTETVIDPLDLLDDLKEKLLNEYGSKGPQIWEGVGTAIRGRLEREVGLYELLLWRFEIFVRDTHGKKMWEDLLNALKRKEKRGPDTRKGARPPID